MKGSEAQGGEEGEGPEGKECVRTHALTFLVLDHGLDVGDGVAALDLQRCRLPGQRLHEDLHLAGARGLHVSSSSGSAAAL